MSSAMKQIPALSPRAHAARLLESVLNGRATLDEALAAHPLSGAEPDQKFTLLLVQATLRQLGQVDALLARYLDKPLPAKRSAVQNALRLGVTQLLLLGTPAHAAVNETVSLIKRGKDSALSGLVNAVLQKIARERPELPPTSANLPKPVRDRWQRYGKAGLDAIAALSATRPPLDLNTLAVDVVASGERLDPQTVRLAVGHAPVETLPGYHEGAFFVQDLAASYPARLFGELRGKTVLDLCAAPGGKAAQLARAGANVTVLDRSGPRMLLLNQNMARLRYEVETVIADILEWVPQREYDAILLDAPCSATGTWRRHPEVVHIVTPEEIAELAMLQRAMLTQAWSWLKPGGMLVYCVCSLEQEEGEAQASWFLEQFPDAVVKPVGAGTGIPSCCVTSEGYLRTLPSHLAEKGGMDGFFAMALEKK